MLSVATLKSVSQAAIYYENGDYYTKEEQQNSSCWFGVGAKKLGLAGLVAPDVFKKLLKGELPDGTIMHQGYNAKGKKTRRAGYDLTFSAVKSASILAFKDPRIIAAHNKAVTTTLQRIEQQGSARVKINGVVTNKTTKNLVVATFLHKVSRLLDPDLHTHCVIMNITAIAGKYRSIYGDDFYNLKKILGLEYRLALAQNLMHLGYELEQTSKEGFFEIKGLSKALIKQLSKRREEIEQVLKELNLDSQQKVTMVLNKGSANETTINTVASAMANFITRERKKFADLKQLAAHWEQEIIKAGSSVAELENIIKKSYEQGPIKVSSQEEQIGAAYSLAIKHLSAQKAIFSRRELLFTVKAFCITTLPNDAVVEQIMMNNINEKELIPLKGDRFTTFETVQLEKNNILIMQQQQGVCSSCLPIGAKLAAKLLLKEPNQREALQLLLASKDRFLAIDAYREQEQQQVLKAFNLVSFNAKNYVIAPTYEQAKKFAAAIEVERAFSLNGFLYYVHNLIKEQDLGELDAASYCHIWLLQKSQLLSNKDVASILEYAIKLDAKVIFIGDRMGQSGRQAGQPFRAFLENGIKYVSLASDNLDHLSLLRAQKVQAAIAQMEQRGDVIAILNRESRINSAALFAVDNNAVLIAQNYLDQQTFNGAVRKQMQQKGMLSGAAIKVAILVPVYLSNTQKQSLANYQIGDVVRFNQGIQNTIYKQGSYFTILEINHKTNKVLLEKNKKCYWLNINEQIYNKLSLYRSEARELQIGDLLNWNDSTPKKLQVHSDFTKEQAKVVNINNKQQITLMLTNNKTFTIDLTKNKNQHIEYAYAQTLNKVKYQELTNGVLLLNDNLQAISLVAIYTALAAIKENRKIYCNNIESLKQAISKNVGLTEHAHLEQQVALDRKVQQDDFSKIKGELQGTLANYSSMLATVPEINLLSNKDSKELKVSKTPEYLQAIEAVNFAIATLSERTAVFTATELLYVAKKYDIKIASDLIETAVDQAIVEGWLINKGENTLLTKEVYAMECVCLKIQKQGEGILEPMVIGPNPRLDAIRDHKYFTEAQKQAVLLIATSSDRVNLIQGIAGSGKTSMLKEVKKLAKESEFQLLGVTNTASSKNNLQNKSKEPINDGVALLDAGIPARTLTSFINEATKMLATNYNLAREIYTKNTIFILDEASLVAVRDMFTFLYIVEQLGARAVIVGDHKQLPAIEASHPFKLLLGKSNSKVVMNINTRLKTKEALSLMQDLYAIRLDDAFDKLLDNLIEIPNRGERLQAMASYYLAATKEDREQIMPMLPLNKDRVEFNTLVRAGLKKEGTLVGLEISSDILVAKDLTFAETNYSLSFDTDDLVKFNHTVKRLGINKGDFLLVTGRRDHQVLLLDQNGNKVSWDPGRFAAYFKGAIEVYTKDVRKIMAGDVIRWSRNDETRAIINSEIAEIVEVREQFAKVKLSNGKLLKLDLDKEINQHWDHAYGSTVHVVQGLDRYNPIGQGLGPAPYVRKVDEVEIGDQIVIPGDPNKNTISKVGKVVDVIFGTKMEIVAVDRIYQQHRFVADQVKVYPDFTRVKVPKISSLESLLVMATRGDKLVMFVDNIEGYKIAVTYNQNLKKTALAVMLPKVGIEIQNKVNSMTEYVYGLAAPEEMDQSIKNNRDITAVSNKTAQTIKEKNAKIKDVTTKVILDFNKSKTQLKKPNYDVNELKQQLAIDILSYVSSWKGKPKQTTPREARWGKKGSFSVVIAGPKKGTWADFEAGVAGCDLISLYMYIFNRDKGSFAEVLEELANKVGVDPVNNIDNHKITEQKARKLAQEREQYINKVQKLYCSSTSIKGTLAEKYCYQHRGIKAKLPDNFRFKARCWHEELKTYKPALIVPGSDQNGKLQSVNRIYLNNDGSKLNETFKDAEGNLQTATAKRNYGPTLGATIKVNENFKAAITMVTEGVENALSIKEVVKDVNIISSFGVGQLKNVTFAPATKTIILCADNDGIVTNTKSAVLDALQKWQNQGYQVKIAMPFDNDLSKKFDFNDLLNKQGEQAINKCLSKAIDVGDLSSFSNKNTALSQDFIKIQNQKQFNAKKFAEKDILVTSKDRDQQLL